jgi:hypothetical protein
VPVAAATVTVTAVLGTAGSGAHDDPTDAQHSRLLARSVLDARTFREGSPPSGAYIGAADRTTAHNNGVDPDTASPDFFAHQPVQGISALIPDGQGTWFALSDNGYGSRQSSADWQLVVNRVDPHLGDGGEPEVLETIVLSDPDHHLPWQTVCDPTVGDPLPPFDFNTLPASPPAACAGGDRILTGFDLDPESMQIGADGTFWIGDEFGPFVLHFDRDGRLLEPPSAVPGVKAPQNPTLDLSGAPADRERPTVASSRGFEGMAISPDRRTLYPVFEGPVPGDDDQTLQIREFDIRQRRFTDRIRRVRLEFPGQPVNLAALNLPGSVRAYPDDAAPTGAGGESLPELIALGRDRFLAIERDGNGDAQTPAPRFKKLFLLDFKGLGDSGGYVRKQLLVDLMAVPDPAKVGGDGDFFRFPFNTIESVHPVDASTLIVADDNNFPFSNGRSRANSVDRSGPLAPDDDEFILIRLGTPLDVDGRILNPST